MEDAKLKPFGCELCSKVYKSKDGLYTHTYYDHGQVKKFCSLCRVFFETEPDLRIHNLVSHGTSFLICGLRHKTQSKCKLQFKTEDEFQTHLQDKMEERKPCEICAAKFPKRSNPRWWHMIFIHKVGKLYICGKCDDWYTDSVDGLRKHESRDHCQLTHPSTKPHISLDGNLISCGVCKRKFEFVKTLIHHIQDKHGEILRNTDITKPVKCNICRKKFSKEGDIRQHILAKHSQHLEPKLEIDDALGELDSKMDIKIEIKMEPVVKEEYYEEIIDIKPVSNYGDDFNKTVKNEDSMVDDQVDIKIEEEDLKTFKENESTSSPIKKLKDNRNDNGDAVMKKKVQKSAINTLSIKDLIQGKQTQKPTGPPCLSLASSNYHQMHPIIPPTCYPSVIPQSLAMPPAQYEYGYQHQYHGWPWGHGSDQSHFVPNCSNQPTSATFYYDDAGNLVQRRPGVGS